MNYFKTFFLMALLTLLLVFVGKIVAGQEGMLIALLIAGVMNFISYYFSDKIVLKAYHASEILPKDAPQLYAIVEHLAQRAGLPTPKIYIAQSNTPNAFATGRNPEHAAVCVTTGLLQILDANELAGVLGHELTHVKNRDILTGTIVATMVGAIGYLAYMAQWAAMFGGFGNSGSDRRGNNMFVLIIAAVLTPIMAAIIQLAISRQREYAADKGGAVLCDNPLYLANALRKLEHMNKAVPMPAAPLAQSTAHMFIVNPFARGGFLRGLFSTHPSTEKRIQKLESLLKEV
jgi:heat shock protein HtpX